MEIKNKPTLAEKQAFWAEQLPNFESKYWLPSHFELLEFDMEGGNYEVRDVLPEHCSEDDASDIYHRVNTGWAMWKKAINFIKAQAVPEGFNFGLAHDTKINDPKELLFRCLRNMKFEKGFRANQNWVHVKHMCCLGSTTATMLCRFFGVDPDGIKFEVIEAQEQSHD